MTITLNAPYSIYVSGASVDLDNATEAALVVQGRAVYTVNPGSVFFPQTPKEIQDQRDIATPVQALVSAPWVTGKAIAVELAKAGRPALRQAQLWTNNGAAGQPYKNGDVYRLSTGQLIVCILAGTGSTTTEPTFSDTAEMTDGAAKWWAVGRMTQSPPAGFAVPTVLWVAGNTALTAYNPFGSPSRFYQPTTPNIQGDLNASSGITSQNQGWLFNDGTAVDSGFGANGRQGFQRCIEFWSDTDILEIGVFTNSVANERLRVYIDDYPMEEAPTVSSSVLSVNASGFLRISFAASTPVEGRKLRLWRIESNAATLFKAIGITTGATLYPAQKSGLLGLFISDSFGNTVCGASAAAVTTTSTSTNFSFGVNFVAEEMTGAASLRKAGIRYASMASIGGSGYNTPGASSRYSARNLLAFNNFASIGADVVVFCHGYNEYLNDATANIATAAAATAAWTSARAQFPNALIVVIGPWSANKSAIATMIALDVALQAAFQAWADPRSTWESPITGGTIQRGTLSAGVEAWTTGTGSIGNGGSANSLIYTGNDASHPSPVGRTLYLTRVAAAIQRGMAAYIV
jgi:hypothetical protein